MFKEEYLKFLCCPDCRGALKLEHKTLICKSCNFKYPVIGNIPILLSKDMASDVKLSQKKWEEEYKSTVNKKRMDSLKKGFENTYLQSHMKYFNKFLATYRIKTYLELGSGPFFIGQKLARLGIFAVGIDYSLSALKLAQYYLKKEKISNYFLVCADLQKMPFKENSFDLLYGGGVIEHFKDTVSVVKENFRVLRKGGVALNTVPYLNLGSLTYRQVWGNIPNIPVIKDVAEFVHVKVLKGKHMIFGYEYSFSKGQLLNIFIKSGFRKKNIEIGRFEVPLIFEYIRSKYLKKLAQFIAKSDLFWPALYILAKK